MINIGKETRLTDELERHLMAQAIEEQMRFKPGKALKTFFTNLFSKLNREENVVSTDVRQTAN